MSNTPARRRLLFLGPPLAVAAVAGGASRADAAGAAGSGGSAKDAWKTNGNKLGANESDFLGATNAQPLIFKTTKTDGGSPKERMRIARDGRVSVGTDTSFAQLQVSTSDYSSGLRVTSFAEGNDVSAISAFSQTGSAASFECNGTGVDIAGGNLGLKVTAATQSTSGQGYAVKATGRIGLSATGSDYGVDAYANNGSSNNERVGVRGIGYDYGVVGLADYGSSVNVGVHGEGPCGVSGFNSLGGAGMSAIGNRGIYANGDFDAGFFQGKVTVNGTLAKSGGSFLIDHPLDPDHKWLRHSFVESPDMMNVYNGNVTLDADGEAVVDLPDYFETLNRDFRYQLTCIGGSAPVYVADEVADGRFRIAGGTDGLKVSWQVTGIRQDEWAQHNPIVVEELKPKKDRGTRAFVAPGSKAKQMHGGPGAEVAEALRKRAGRSPVAPGGGQG